MTYIYPKAVIKKASDHLFYEIWMINRLNNLFSSRFISSLHDKLTNHTHENFSVVIPQSTGILEFSSITEKEEKQVLNNAIIEALAIHIRTLLDFFYLDQKRWDDDVIAIHFFIDKNDWINNRPSKTKEEIKLIKNRVNKEIAHLTYFRQGVTDKSWLFQEMVDEINNVVSKFCEIVPQELLGDRWKDDHTA